MASVHGIVSGTFGQLRSINPRIFDVEFRLQVYGVCRSHGSCFGAFGFGSRLDLGIRGLGLGIWVYVIHALQGSDFGGFAGFGLPGAVRCVIWSRPAVCSTCSFTCVIPSGPP